MEAQIVAQAITELQEIQAPNTQVCSLIELYMSHRDMSIILWWCQNLRNYSDSRASISITYLLADKHFFSAELSIGKKLLVKMTWLLGSS